MDRIQVALGNLAACQVGLGQGTEARETVRECLHIYREIDNRYGATHFLVVLAAALQLLNESKTAAQVFGAVDRELDEGEGELEKLESSLYEKTATLLETEMGEQEFLSAKREGRKLSWKEAIDLA